MRASVLAGLLVLLGLGAPAAPAQDVTVGAGGVAVTASADARCQDPPDGAVDRGDGGDDTAPYAATATAEASVACGGQSNTARGDASASGGFVTGRYGTVISGSGTASAGGANPHAADSFAEFFQDFAVNAPVDYALSVSGLVEFGGGLTNSVAGTLQPGAYRVRGFASSPGCPSTCGSRGFSLTLELGLPEDTDGDALFDVWETEGIDADGDGTPELDLPDLGAKPLHKDVFLEIDHMTGHALSQTAIDRVVEAYANAPVGNPDGRPGITLHVDNGPTSRMDPTTGEAWGADRSDADELPHQPVLGTMAGRDYVWTAFDELKEAHLEPERAAAFHYLVSGHRFGSPTNNASGISRDFGASDLLVMLGSVSEPGEGSGAVQQQAGTIMHELGHNMGLHHGGDDDGNYEPNHLSVMNYAFQFTGIPRVDGTDVLDYSRLAVDLDERALNENVGFGLPAGGEPAEWLTIFRCPDTSRRWAFLQAARTDWDCDGTPRGIVARDLNGDAVARPLVPFLEWPALVFHGGSIGGAGLPVAERTELIEPPAAELLDNAEEVQRARDDIAAGVAPLPPAGPGGNSGPGGPGGSGGPGGGVVTDEPPVLSGLGISPSSFAAARRGPSAGRRGPALLRFRASRAGFARFTVERLLPGRRAGRRCVAPRRHDRRPRCVRSTPVRGSFTLPVAAGANRLRFTGRLRNRALAPGRYRLVATPLSARQRRPGTVRRAPFRIVRTRR